MIKDVIINHQKVFVDTSDNITVLSPTVYLFNWAGYHF